MARQKYYVGSVGPLLYDDAVPVNDPDGDFAGEDVHAFMTLGQLYVEEAPTQPNHVLRYGDYLSWTKVEPDSISITNGTITGSVNDLDDLGDGNFLKVDEAAATPGIDLIVDFVSITNFHWVHILAWYNGSATHALGVQLYDWVNTKWDTFNAIQTAAGNVTTASGYILGDYSFNILGVSNYIGTGANAGDVRIRFYHTMAGDASHDLWLDVVSLYY